MAVAQRVRQFFAALTAALGPDEEHVAERYLSPEQLALFRSMPVNDRRHALEVLHRILTAGHSEPDLLRAALLHDAGKARAAAGLATRVAVVLLARIDPRLVDLLARRGGTGWRHSLYLYWHHAEFGATLAASAGSSHKVYDLIANHSHGSADPLAQALHEADERS